LVLLLNMTHRVELKSGKYSFSADSHESILDAAIRAGVPINYGCSNGNCGLCKAKVVTGSTTQMRAHDYVVADAEKIQGHALMCSTSCQSDVVIEADVISNASDIPAQELRVKVRKIVSVMTLPLLPYRFRVRCGCGFWLANM